MPAEAETDEAQVAPNREAVMRTALARCRAPFILFGLFSGLIDILCFAPSRYMRQVYNTLERLLISARVSGRVVDETSGQFFFVADAEFPESELDRPRAVRDRDTSVRAGIPLQAFVPPKKRTTLDYLLKPLTQMLTRSVYEC